MKRNTRALRETHDVLDVANHSVYLYLRPAVRDLWRPDDNKKKGAFFFFFEGSNFYKTGTLFFPNRSKVFCSYFLPGKQHTHWERAEQMSAGSGS